MIPESFDRGSYRASKCLAKILSHEGGTPYLGSATLVTVASRAFLFTAGHNLCVGDSPVPLPSKALGIAFPHPESGLATPVVFGAKFLAFKSTPKLKPDAGYVELDPKCRGLWKHLEPRTLDDIQPVEILTHEPDEQVVLLGFPRHYVRHEGKLMEQDYFTMEGQRIRARVRKEHKGERGIFVKLDGEFEDMAGNVMGLPDTDGMMGISGGPVVRIRGDEFDFIGIAISILDGSSRKQRCVPAYEVVRLFLDHPDPDVVDEARRCLERLGV